MKKKHLLLSLLLATPFLLQAQSGTMAKTGNHVKVYVTARNTDLRFTPTETLTLTPKPQPAETQISVFVDPTKTFQTMLGIGGALTDASAETFYKLPVAKQQEVISAYYDKNKGLGYTFGRTNIQSCDFSSDTYSYVGNNDFTLKTFDISHDRKYRIPFIKTVQKAAGSQFNMFVTPWSPPAWMKDNNDMLHGGKLKPEFRQTWADFFVKFIKTYEKEGVPIWGYSIQNEPMASQSWESCVFTANEERDFIKKNLGPTMRNAGLGSKKMIIWDHNRDLMYQYVSTILEDPEAAPYVWGIGFHWYETWTGAGMQFESTRLVEQAFPTKSLVYTEGSVEHYDFARLNDWALGERYGLSMVHDFNSGTVAWTDWNVLLDEKGGPNHVGNFCFAPIHADLRNGSLIYTNSYYYIGHFSKFIAPGSKRIACVPSRDNLLSTAYVAPDGKISVVVLNLSDNKIPYSLWMKGQGAETTSLPHSITTLVIE